MIPKIIHQSTSTGTWEELHLIERIKRVMPEYRHILWDPEQNLELMQKTFPQYVDQYVSFDRPVIRFDVSRCLYMHSMGGIYCDTDFVFFRPLDQELLRQKCLLGIEEVNNVAVGGGYKVGNAFLASEPGLPMWAEFVESIFERHRQGETRVVFLSGPHALTLFLKSRKEYESLVTFLPPNCVYPDRRYLGLQPIRGQDTFAAHLCWGGWRDKNLMHRFKNRARRCISAVL